MITIEEFQLKLSALNYLSIVGPLATRLPKRLSDPTVFVDGGSRLRTHSMKSSLSIGDGDSSSPEDMDLLLPTEKDVSDLGFVLSNLPGQIKSLDLSGFFGRRLDHQLANLGVIHEYLLRNPTLITFDEAISGWGLPANLTTTLNIQGPFSLFSLQAGQVSLKGQVRYELTSTTLLSPLSSLGLSNEGLGNCQILSDTPLFILPSTGE